MRILRRKEKPEGFLRIPRRMGAVTAIALIVLGAWAALVPFVGPWFELEVGTEDAWEWQVDKLWISILPGAAAMLGGLLLLGSANRAGGGLGAWLALVGGIWLLIGPIMSLLWQDEPFGFGPAIGDDGQQTLELIAYFFGSGALITALSAFALGRMSIRPAEGVLEERPVGAPATRRGPVTARTAE